MQRLLLAGVFEALAFAVLTDGFHKLVPSRVVRMLSEQIGERVIWNRREIALVAGLHAVCMWRAILAPRLRGFRSRTHEAIIHQCIKRKQAVPAERPGRPVVIQGWSEETRTVRRLALTVRFVAVAADGLDDFVLDRCYGGVCPGR